MSTQPVNNVQEVTVRDNAFKQDDKAPHVLQAINSIQRDLVINGISKNRKTTGYAKYNFRGIDDIYNALSPLMAEHGLVILPNYSNLREVERKSNNGGLLLYTMLDAEYRLISVKDGSEVIARTIGQGMDSGDKGVNKAMSIAYKYMAFQVFAIPTEGTDDPDDTVHPPQPYPQQPYQEQSQRPYNNGGNPRQVSQQPQRKQLQPPVNINNIKSIPWLNQSIAVTVDGKHYANHDKTQRIFNQEQFVALVQSIIAGKYPITKFMDANAYVFSNEQIAVLKQLVDYQPNSQIAG